MLKPVIAFLCCVAVPVVEAQVRVIDSSPQSVRSGGVRPQESIDQKTEAYNQLQSLLQEVAELRGQVEEQGHEIARLKQLQLDNYMDLDRRVSFLTGNAKAKSTDETSSDVPVVATNEEAPAGAASEADEYKAAYDLLRARQVDESLTAFKSYLKKYPCLLYTSPSPRDRQKSRMPSSA